MRRRGLLTILLTLVLVFFAWLCWPQPRLPANARVDKILVLKSSRKLILMKQGKELKAYRISLGWNPVGPKCEQGDGKTPEGNYVIDGRNPRSRYHLSLHISYPDKTDTLRALARGKSPGGDIMIHGGPGQRRIGEKLLQPVDWTAGCIGVSDAEIEEIWKVVPNGTPVEIRP